MNISVFGMGIIGSRCAENLETAGHQVTLWNRTPKNLPNTVSSPQAAAQASKILSFYLKDAQAMREIFSAIQANLTASHVVLNHSTIDLATTLWLADQCKTIGCSFIDAPFTGSKLAAADGKLMYYLACDEEHIAHAEEILAPTASAVIRMGKIGNATIVKLATNLIAACNIQALAEAQAISLAHGISADSFANAITQHGTASALVKMKLPGMLRGDFDTHFSLDNMRKDSVYAMTLAAEAGLEVPCIHTVSARMTELCNNGLADADYTALVAPYIPSA